MRTEKTISFELEEWEIMGYEHLLSTQDESFPAWEAALPSHSMSQTGSIHV